MTSVARAAYSLQVAWSSYNLGLATFDYSTFDGADTLATSPLDVNFGGPYDDVSSRLRSASWTRGRDDTLASMLATTGTIRLFDPDGLFDNRNAASPLYGIVDDRLHPVKLDALYLGARWPLFYGWARSVVHTPSNRGGSTTLELVDLFYWLERARPIIAQTGLTTTGGAINLILDAIGWPNTAAHRQIDAGDSVPNFSANGGATGLEIIAALLNAERGVFYVAGSGRAVFRSRTKRLTLTSQFTLENRMRAIAPGVDWDQVKNRVTVTRIDTGTGNLFGGTGGVGVAGVASKAGGGQATFGLADPAAGAEPGTPIYSVTRIDSSTSNKVAYSDLPAIVTPYLPSNSQADDLADFVLSQVKEPRSPVYGLTIDNRDSDLLLQILQRDLVDRIKVRSNWRLRNLVTHPNFDPLTLTPWVDYSWPDGVAGLTRDPATHAPVRTNGLAAARIGMVKPGGAGSRRQGTWPVPGMPIPVVAGETYTLSGYVKASQAGATIRAYRAGPDTDTATSWAVGVDWTRISHTFTPTTNGNTFILFYEDFSLPDGAAFWLDAVQLELGPVPTAYLDGSSGGTWEGTPNASRTIEGESGEFHIERVAHELDIQTRRHSLACLLSEAAPYQAATFDAGLFDSAIFVY